MSGRQSTNGTPSWVPGYGLGPILLGLAAWFAFGPEIASVPSAATPPFDRSALSTAPRRHAMGDPPTIQIGGYARTCMDCHRIFDAQKQGQNDERLQHSDIKLRHTPAMTCASCHDPKDRDRLVGPDGSPLAYTDVVQLCATCHSRKYADWQSGAHGRTNGYWNPELGERDRRICTECHDPHRPAVPAMAPLVPLPGPHTLRMGEQHHHGDKVLPKDSRDPLQRALRRVRELEDRMKSREPRTGGAPVKEDDR